MELYGHNPDFEMSYLSQKIYFVGPTSASSTPFCVIFCSVNIFKSPKESGFATWNISIAFGTASNNRMDTCPSYEMLSKKEL
ncbi:hypothetical protein PPL_10443 [Heterostelium album PN500]|uniref:Uncharacterized protein n=1 Tax=Heterostelium pallidum (strain ATCC 26659 / Pp 5 / PN500) TaxID=670386 RepID=D3BR39_HETP5|nr:hypothetical protein PPL_10443 [Heterostelium album PN500]EFA75871.1 hypothetical protein PPL_10443 [Heterostelium album PN500]|eukprot:XP_020428005.1 hypothetical protein PPL_10443 [Heterostelium album PN500]